MRPFEGWRVQFAARRIGEYKVMIVMMLFFWEPDLNLELGHFCENWDFQQTESILPTKGRVSYSPYTRRNALQGCGRIGGRDLDRRRELRCVRRWCSRSGRTWSGNARSVAAECAAVVGHGDGGAVSLPLLERQWGLFAPPDGIEVFQNVVRERDKRKKKKVVGSGVVCCRVLRA